MNTSHAPFAEDLYKTFAEQGYLIVPDVLTTAQCATLKAHVVALTRHHAGTRALLDHAWCRDLAAGRHCSVPVPISIV